MRVSDHSFGIFDRHEIPIETADWSTGLVVMMSIGAMIYTGIDRGYVHLTTEVRASAPDEIDPGPWEDIVEASVYAPHGELRIHQLEYRSTDHLPPLPLLSVQGPGSYRLRAHARGRDLYFDAVHNDPAEDYLLTIWPASPLPAIIIRATDRCGYGLRLSSLNTPKSTLTPATPPAQPTTQQQHARLRRATLESFAQSQSNPPAETA